MGSVNNNFLPASTGLSLGSSNQLWNAWLNLLNNHTPVTLDIQPTPYSNPLAIITTAPFTVVTMTLIGDITASTFSGVAGLVVFILMQDPVGGRAFTWPTNFFQPTGIGPVANQATAQVFYFDGTSGYPLGPGVLYP